MSCIQAAIVRPYICVRTDPSSHSFRSAPVIRATCSNPSSGPSLNLSFKRLTWQQFAPVLKHRADFPGSKNRQFVPLGLFGGKGKSEGENEGSAWKGLEKAMGSFRKENSIEDVLRQQIEKQEFYDDGGTGGKPPRQGGGGGGGDFGGTGDEGLAGILDEALQVFLATVGFIFLYVYIISGEEMTRLAKDYLKYLFGASKSVRLRRAMYKWGRFYKKMTEKKEVDPYWLEREIINTATWWDSPEKYRRLLRSSYEESRQEEPGYDEEL